MDGKLFKSCLALPDVRGSINILTSSCLFRACIALCFGRNINLSFLCYVYENKKSNEDRSLL
jgi:hypothetical protein